MKLKQTMKSAEFMRLSLRFVTDNLLSYVGPSPVFYDVCVDSSIQLSVLCILYCVSSFAILFRRLPVSLDCSCLITHSGFPNVTLQIYSCFIVFLQKQFANQKQIASAFGITQDNICPSYACPAPFPSGNKTIRPFPYHRLFITKMK